jgi:acyl homoserine lactone synthase
MGSARPPHAADIWEISRFSSSILSGGHGTLQEAHANTRVLLAEIVRFAERAGVKRLITVSPLAVERLLNRLKVHSHRAAPPLLIDGKPVFACWIELDDITLNALDITPSYSRDEMLACHS